MELDQEYQDTNEMTGVLRPISTLQKVRGDRVLGYDEDLDIYAVMMWNGGKFVTIPGGITIRPTGWLELPVPRQRRKSKQTE